MFWVLWGQKEPAKRLAMQQKVGAYLNSVRNPAARTPEGFEQLTGIKLAEAETAWKEFVISLDATKPDGGLDYLKPSK